MTASFRTSAAGSREDLAVPDPEGPPFRVGDQGAFVDADDPGISGDPVRPDPKVIGHEGPREVDPAAKEVRDVDVGRLRRHAAVLGNKPAAREHHPCLEALEVFEDDEVRQLARSDRAELVVEPEEHRGVQARHCDRGDGIYAGADRHAELVVHMPDRGEVARILLVRAEHEEPGRGGVRSQKPEKCAKIGRGGTLARHYLHPEAELLQGLLRGRRLVARVEACRDVCLQPGTVDPGGVPREPLAGRTGRLDRRHYPGMLAEDGRWRGFIDPDGLRPADHLHHVVARDGPTECPDILKAEDVD